MSAQLWNSLRIDLSKKLKHGLTTRLRNNIRARSSAASVIEGATVIVDEIDKFNIQSMKWWAVYGEAKGLHSMNALRVPLIRDGILYTIENATQRIKSPKPLSNFKLLDVGCGGGVLSEPLARLGANVTGLDASEDMIKVANDHAKLDKSLLPNLNYQCSSVEQHLSTNETRYDAVIASEVAEHVNDLRLFVDTCIKLTKENGSLFFTTINKTNLSWLLAILMAENVLNIVPQGTHSFEKLVPPEKLIRILKDGGCRVNIIHGMCYNPIINKWHWIQNTDVNYAIHAIKEEKINKLK